MLVLDTELIGGSDNTFLVFSSVCDILTFDLTFIDALEASVGFPAFHVNEFEVMPSVLVHEGIPGSVRRDDFLGGSVLDAVQPIQNRTRNC